MFDNISIDDLNIIFFVSFYFNIIVFFRKNIQLKIDLEKCFIVDEIWDSFEELKKLEEDFDSYGDVGGKWKIVFFGFFEDFEKVGQKVFLFVLQIGFWRRGMFV